VALDLAPDAFDQAFADSHIMTSREEPLLDLGMRGGRLTDLKLCVECFITPRNDHRAHARIQCPWSSYQFGGTH
jgi:hypothetical protein